MMRWSWSGVDWLEAAGASTENSKRGLHYNHSHIVIRSAIAGEGLALGRSMLVAEEIANGKLIAPFDFRIPSKFSYYMVCPKELAEQASISAFRDWLLKEAIKTMAMVA